MNCLSTKTPALNDPRRSQRLPVALAHSVEAFLCALALTAATSGCKATPPLAPPHPPDAQTRPLSPQEWTQRNFPEESRNASGQIQNPPPGLQTSPQTTAANLPAEPANPPPQANVPPPAAPPAPQSGPSVQPESSTPVLLAQASAPASAPAPAAPAPVQPAPQVSEPAPPAADTNQPTTLRLREGDTVRITFPGAHGMDTVQQIRRGGKITLQMVGDVKAAGLARTELEQELLRLYGPQLQDKEVQVTIDSAAFAVYVTGAVMRPGKLMSDRDRKSVV